MRSFLDAKAMAKSLRSTLSKLDIPITHSQSLEITAAQFGCDDWNVLAAKIEAGRRQDPVGLKPAIPIFRIFDEAKAREFYLDYLGFSWDWEHRFHEKAPLYAQVSRSALSLHLSEHHGDCNPGATAFVWMSGVAAYQRELKAKAYAYMNPGIQDLPWGRQLEVIDPFGNHIRFCEPAEVT